jgi:hypothetical protein
MDWLIWSTVVLIAGAVLLALIASGIKPWRCLTKQPKDKLHE